MQPLKSLQISVTNFSTETSRILKYIDDNFFKIIINPGYLSSDVDHLQYCREIQALVNFSNEVAQEPGTDIICGKLNELKAISEKDFRLYESFLPQSMLLLLAPIGIFTAIKTYSKLSTLQNKLRDIERSTGTLSFMLRAMNN